MKMPGAFWVTKWLQAIVKPPRNRLGLLFLILKEQPPCSRIKLYTVLDHCTSTHFPFPHSFLLIRTNTDRGLHADWGWLQIPGKCIQEVNQFEFCFHAPSPSLPCSVPDRRASALCRLQHDCHCIVSLIQRGLKFISRHRGCWGKHKRWETRYFWFIFPVFCLLSF